MRAQVLSRLKMFSNESKARLSSLMNLPIEHRADGCYIYDENGQSYLDCGGFGVFILGHRHPKVLESVSEQLNTLPMSSRSLVNPTLATASEKLIQYCPDNLQFCFFTNSGAESTELGLKLARANGCEHIIAIEGSYHGKTLGALSVTHRDEFRAPFTPLFENVSFIARNDIKALDSLAATLSGKVAVIVEPVQGEGGVHLMSREFMHALKSLCEHTSGLFICDEVQSGLARCGRRWAIEYFDIEPDILLIGKGLSGGVVPCAAVAATPQAFAPLNRDFMLHSSTFGGSPIALAAAIATLDILSQEQIASRSEQLGKQIVDTLKQLSEGYDIEIRGQGLLIGIDAKTPARAGQLTLSLLQEKVITSHSLSAATTVRLTPSALLTPQHLSHLFNAFERAIKTL